MSFVTAKVGGASAGAFAEYLSEQADLVADYYGAHELEGMAFTRVQGRAAAHLGVETGLTMEQFEDLHHGRWDGRQLSQVSYRPVWQLDAAGKFVRDSRGHKIAARNAEGKMVTTPYRNSWIDAVWAAPKSVSEYMISTTPEVRAEMVAAWDASCAEGVKAIEDRAYLLRRTLSRTSVNGTRQQGSATERVRGAHLLVVPATQLAARHTEETIERGAPPDPHLHTHNAISTLAFLPDATHPAGMRPLTVDEIGLKRFGEEANAVVMGDYARRLEDMGIEVDYGKMEENRHGTISWEIAGVSPDEIRFHSSNSKRRDAIVQQWEHDYGRPPTRPELDKALRQSRISKKQDAVAKEADRRGVWHLWKADKEAHGFAVPERRPREPVARESVQKRQKVLYDRLMGPKGLCKATAEFSADSILTSMELASVGLGFTQDELKAMEAGVRKELVLQRPANAERCSLYTTKVELAKEARIERGLRYIASQQVAAPTDEELAAAVEAQKHELDPKQVEAVEAATSQKMAHIQGRAGSGKSTTMRTARQALVDAKLIDRTIVVSTAAATAQRSGIAMGADFYGSVESIERAMQSGKLVPSDRTLWIVDEAAMLDNDHCDRLLMAARAQGRFVFVGDDAQLSPIGAAGWYQESIQEHGYVMLEKSHRFTGPTAEEDVADYTRLRNGNIEDTRTSVENLSARGRIHEAEDPSDRMKMAFKDYQKMRDDNPDLSVDDFRMIIETSNADVDTANRFIQFDQKTRGELQGEGFRVQDDEQGRQWSLHENESVIFLRSYVYNEWSKPIRNGTKARIARLDEEAREAIVRLESGEHARVKLQEFEKSQPMAPAGAQHANKIQGDEVDYAQILPGTDHTANANSAYSQLTRAKKEAHVYLDRETHGDQPQEAIVESWSERVEKRTALSRRREREQTTIGLDTPYEKSTAPHERSHEERKREPEPTPPVTPAEGIRAEREPAPAHDRDKPAPTNGREVSTEHVPAATAVKERETPAEHQETQTEKHERTKDRELGKEQSPVAPVKVEKPAPVVEQEVPEPEQQQPKEPEAERQREQGSLREEGRTYHRDRERGRGRATEHEEQRSSVEREFTHLRERGQDRGFDRGR